MLPYYFDYITLDCPRFKGFDLLNTNIRPVLRCFNIEKGPKVCPMVWILRILLSEKNLIILGNDENRLTKFCEGFLSLLYPFEWICQYIPILNDKNVKNLDLSVPFLIVAHFSFLDKITKLLEKNQNKNDVILLYLHEGYIEESDFDLGSSLTLDSNMDFKVYFDKFVPNFPDDELYWGLARILKEKNSSSKVKQYTNEAKYIDRLLQEVAIINYEQYIIYIQKTKEKKRKQFYLNLSKTRFYNNFINTNPNFNKDKT
jgi:hypothetical protein